MEALSQHLLPVIPQEMEGPIRPGDQTSPVALSPYWVAMVITEGTFSEQQQFPRKVGVGAEEEVNVQRPGRRRKDGVPC